LLSRRGDREIRAQDLPLCDGSHVARRVGSATTLAELSDSTSTPCSPDELASGNAAKILGISSKTLYRKIRSMVSSDRRR
jgi:hypothetical protein